VLNAEKCERIFMVVKIKAMSFFVVLILLFLCVLYFWVGYINKTVSVGDAYGFTIGDSKIETYKKASGMLKNLSINDSPIFIDVVVTDSSSLLLSTNSGFTVMAQTLLHESGFVNFKEKDKWSFYFHGTYFDSLSLKFCDERLCEIHRHRKRFEIP
jgi:hypothetical protein